MSQDPERRIQEYTRAVEQMLSGNFDLNLSTGQGDGEIDKLGLNLRTLAGVLARQTRELENLGLITEQVNAGVQLEDVLEQVYRTFHDIIPFVRIGFSLLVENEEGEIMVRARWAKSEYPNVELPVGYQDPLKGSSLQRIIETGEPRIINDLEAHYAAHPDSDSTRRILAEGIRASLTCPLIANGIPIGFMFFSSDTPNTYQEVHVDLFKQIAGQLAVIVEKANLISQLFEKQSAIERQNEELRALNETKNNFLGMAAHDLRNPLSVVLGATEFVLEMSGEPLSSTQRRMINTARKASQKMLELINELLDVSKIEAGHLELNLEDLELEGFVCSTVEMHRLVAESKDIAIVCGETEAMRVRADARRINQVIDNFISNAVKYSPSGTTIQINITRQEGAARFAVIDEGPGIAEDEQPLLFHDFVTISTQPTGDESSTGLGLAICRRIVEAHGGKVGVESVEGVGSTFWFTLPLVEPPTGRAQGPGEA